MANQTFAVSGVSRCKGTFKVRFAASMDRVKTLLKTGHDEIELLELPNPMSKGECATYLKTTSLYERAEYREAIDSADEKYNGSPTVKVSKPKKETPNLESLKARAQEVTEQAAEQPAEA
jgi:hypothetical protein